MVSSDVKELIPIRFWRLGAAPGKHKPGDIFLLFELHVQLKYVSVSGGTLDWVAPTCLLLYVYQETCYVLVFMPKSLGD